MRRGLLLTALCALLAAPPAGATVKRPPVEWFRGDGSYTKASRKPSKITTIVIHATDGGTYSGNVWWLSGGHSHVSSHFVVSRDGQIAQLVHLSDIAWHAGNWKVNVHSVGIEHVGETYDPAGFTDDQYRQSAQLVAWLAIKCGIPIDRKHIIGHADVPDPNDPTQLGGASHHTDPGPYWDWARYMRLVRHYAHPVPPLKVRSTTISHGETVTGIVPWRVATKGATARRVDFLIDGRVVWSDHRAPFAFAGGRGWNTTTARNGRHTLEARAVGPGVTARTKLDVRVRNYAFAITTAGVRPWHRVRGVIHVRANVWGARALRVQLLIDGRPISRDLKRPYTLSWNTHKVADGKHTIQFVARAVDGRIAQRKVVVVVSNRVPVAKPRPVPKPTPRPKPKPTPKPKPKPKPTPKPKPKPKPAPPAVTSQTLADGQTVEGSVTWGVQTTGAVARVEFVVDDVVRFTATAAPWTFTWDTTADTPGPHAVAVRAVAGDGRSAQLTATVTVAAPAPAP